MNGCVGWLGEKGKKLLGGEGVSNCFEINGKRKKDFLKYLAKKTMDKF